MNNQNRNILRINNEVIIIIVLILYFILNTPDNNAPSGLKAIDRPIIVDIAISNLSLLMIHWIIVWEYVFKIPINIQPKRNNKKFIILSDCWQNDQNINERIDVLVVFQKNKPYG